MEICNDDDEKNTGFSYGEHLDGQKISFPSADMDPKLRQEAIEAYGKHQKWVFDRLPLTQSQYKDLYGTFASKASDLLVSNERVILPKKKRRFTNQ